MSKPPSPYYKAVTGPRTRNSNIYGNYSGVDASGFISIIWNGNKRLHWKSLPQPMRGNPLGYGYEAWQGTHAKVNYGHEEYGPGPDFNYNYNFEILYTTVNVKSAITTSGLPSEAGYKAKVLLFQQMKGEGANLANMIGERHQVASLVESTIKRFTWTIRDLKRGNIASAIRRLAGDPRTAGKLRGKSVADMWLELQYGWKPLLSDIYDVVNDLHRRELSRLVVFKAKGKASHAFPTQETSDIGKGSQPLGTISAHARLSYMIRAFPDSTFAEPAALGFTNPLTVAWEVTPWSFIVDWFYPVSRYLEQLSADHGWTFRDGCESILLKGDCIIACNQSNNYTSAGWSYINWTNYRGYQRYIRFTRAILGSFPSPDKPMFKNPFSVAHVENALALFAQVVSGGKTPHHGRGT